MRLNFKPFNDIYLTGFKISCEKLFFLHTTEAIFEIITWKGIRIVIDVKCCHFTLSINYAVNNRYATSIRSSWQVVVAFYYPKCLGMRTYLKQIIVSQVQVFYSQITGLLKYLV